MWLILEMLFYEIIQSACARAQSLQLYPTLFELMDCSPPGSSPGKNTGVGNHSLLQGIFLTQGLNPGLLHYRWSALQVDFLLTEPPRKLQNREFWVFKNSEYLRIHIASFTELLELFFSQNSKNSCLMSPSPMGEFIFVSFPKAINSKVFISHSEFS